MPAVTSQTRQLRTNSSMANVWRPSQPEVVKSFTEESRRNVRKPWSHLPKSSARQPQGSNCIYHEEPHIFDTSEDFVVGSFTSARPKHERWNIGWVNACASHLSLQNLTLQAATGPLVRTLFNRNVQGLSHHLMQHSSPEQQAAYVVEYAMASSWTPRS
jgi:hypothetical protein